MVYPALTLASMRVWFSGRTIASQAINASPILATRTGFLVYWNHMDIHKLQEDVRWWNEEVRAREEKVRAAKQRLVDLTQELARATAEDARRTEEQRRTA